jgi:uncharacterized damage-inducible protein DinB
MTSEFPAQLEGPGTQVSDPSALLTGYLDWYRDALVRKTDGLDAARLLAPVPRLGWAPLGLVRHLGWVERRWIRWGFAAEAVPPRPAEDGDAEWRVTGLSVEQVWREYHDEVARTREIVSGVPLERRARLGGRFRTPEQAPTLGRILFHLLQEYARHVGQLDVARELIDGATGE